MGVSPYPALDRWYHVAGTYDGTNLCYYIDGVLDTNLTVSVPGGTVRENAGMSLMIGRQGGYRFNWLDAWLNGNVDDVRVYNRALGTDEIAELAGAPDLDEGLVLHYTFDDFDGVAVADESGTGNTGTVYGASFVSNGVMGGAYAFDGVNDYINCGSDASLQITGSLTYSTWIKTTTDSQSVIVGRRNGDTSTQIASHIEVESDGRFAMGVSGGEIGVGGRAAYSTKVINDGMWHHLAGVYDSGTALTIYIDGVQADQNSNGMFASLNPRQLPMYVGRKNASQSLEGLLDDVRVYSRALSSNEVAQLFEDAGYTPPPPPQRGPVLHYTFDTHDGVTVPDESGSGNDGEVRGTTPIGDGVLYGAYAFDGIDDRISCGLDPSLQITGDLTYTVWVRKTGGEQAVLVGRRNGNDAYHIASHLSANSVGGATFGICSGRWEPAQYVATEGVDLNEGQWYHLAGVYEAGKALRLYVNGALNVEKTHAIFTSLSSRRLPVYVGARENAYFLKGELDDVRIYDRALDASEIATLYDTAATGKVTVVVAGDPGEYGAPTPLGYGMNWIASGMTVSDTVASPAPGRTGIRYLCTGWTGTGDVPASGETNVVTFTPTQASTLTWLWEPQYLLDVSAGNGGSVDITGGWCATGTTVTMTPIADPDFAFAGWTGDVPAGHEEDNPLRVTMDQPRSVTARFRPVSLAAGLRLHYTFDDYDGVTVADQSGTGNHGSLHGPAPALGVIGSAYAFDGVDDYIECGNAPSLQITGGLTYAAWLKTSHDGSLAVSVIRRGGSGSGAADAASRLYVRGVEGTPGMSLNNGRVANQTTDCPVIVNDGDWHHVVATYEPSTRVAIYVDGRLAGERTSSVFSALNARVHQTKVGGRAGFPDVCFPGLIDDLRIYDRVLGSNEVAELYETAGPGRIELVVEAGEGGTVEPGSGLFEQGAEVELTAFPSNGHEFVAWQGDVPPGSQFDNPVSLVMDDHRTVRALFWNRTEVLGLHWNEHGTYFPGENAIQCRFYVPDVDDLMSLVWTPDLPGDWSLVDAEGDGGPRVLGNEVVFTRRHVQQPVEFSYTVAVPAGTAAPQPVGAVATYQMPGMSNPEDVTVLPDPLALQLHDRDMHSADYRDYRWVIDAHELSRVLFYWRAGWYRPDPAGYDGYTGITEPYADASNKLHSADYHPPHWSIGVDEANRVLAYWRAGGFRVDPSGHDGYAAAKGVPGVEPLPPVPPAFSDPGSTAPVEPPTDHDGAENRVLRVLGQASTGGYDPGGTVVITNVVEFDSELLALCIKPDLPPGWTILDVTAEGNPEVAHDEILWTGSLPASPVTIVYTVHIPATCRGTKQVLSHVDAYVSSSANPTNAPASAAQFAMDARDADGDGLPDGWEETYAGGSISLDPDIDNDGDGMDNFQEWIAGTDPTDAASVLVLTGVEQVEGGKLRLTWLSALDRRYHIVTTDNTVKGFMPLKTNLLSTPPANSTEVQVPAWQNGLLRVGVGD